MLFNLQLIYQYRFNHRVVLYIYILYIVFIYGFNTYHKSYKNIFFSRRDRVSTAKKEIIFREHFTSHKKEN